MATVSGKMITRYAPSPTGGLHVGSVRTALFNYLAAKKYGGEMILRIEDTDRERSKKEYEKDILEAMEWLGLSYSSMYRQSERGSVYEKHVQKLLDTGSAYESTEDKDGKQSTVIRFKNAGKRVTFADLLRGDISFDTTELGDFVIARAKNDPLYHLAVVIDDFESGVTHVIRGEDHISNTPRQILIQEALGAPRPIYVHIPLVLAPDRSKLSKRHGAMPVGEYKALGYLPEALLNFLALLGWSPQGLSLPGREGKGGDIFTLKELTEAFSFDHLQKSGAVFDIEKLNWINGEHIRRMEDAAFMEKVREFLPKEATQLPQYGAERLEKIAPILRERIAKFSDLELLRKGGELAYFFEAPEYVSKKALIWKNEAEENTIQHITHIVKLLTEIPDESFTQETVKGGIWDYATEKGRGAVLWPMRYALSGLDKSPDPFALAEVFGKDETIQRLTTALKTLQS
ncbi:MAG: glutamate--tRNA ligase [Parcubacteria group bacterium]|nr:glutamate--tRNA ligase [Parcubacteria group bacterium]